MFVCDYSTELEEGGEEEWVVTIETKLFCSSDLQTITRIVGLETQVQQLREEVDHLKLLMLDKTGTGLC